VSPNRFSLLFLGLLLGGIALWSRQQKPPTPTPVPETPTERVTPHFPREVVPSGSIPKVSADELHWVGYYEGFYPPGCPPHSATFRPLGAGLVKVNRPGKRVLLALTSYEPVVWQVQTAPDTTLAGVLLSGYHTQKAQGLPPQTPVFQSSHESPGSFAYFYAYPGETDADSVTARARLTELAALPIRSFQGAYAANRDQWITVSR
jgi:hypothetical protein